MFDEYPSPLAKKILGKVNEHLVNLALNQNAKNIWTTKDNRKMMLKDMDLNHLRNSIRWCHNTSHIEEAKALTLELARRGEYIIELRGSQCH